MPRKTLDLKLAGFVLFFTISLLSTLYSTSESTSSLETSEVPTSDSERLNSLPIESPPSSWLFPSANHHGQRTSNRSLFKRDFADDYHAALVAGSRYLGAIQAAQCNLNLYAAYFLPSAFDNGWTQREDRLDLDFYWYEYFYEQLGENRVPPIDQLHYITLDQDKNFTNTRGEPVQKLGPSFDTPNYHSFYIPALNAIVIKNMKSPNVVFKTYWQGPSTQILSNAEIAARYTPPLSRWSDVAWTLYGELTNEVHKLQFICHDNVIGTVAFNVIQYIFEFHMHSAFVPFPGLEFGVDSPEGQALLGTPNGLGTAWLLIDRARELGRRNLRVKVWSEAMVLNMAWNMAPL